jgi:hypothetical protein
MTKKKLTGDQIAKNILAVARCDKSGALMINSHECAKAIKHMKSKNKRLREVIRICAKACQKNLQFAMSKYEKALLQALDIAWKECGRTFCERPLKGKK